MKKILTSSLIAAAIASGIYYYANREPDPTTYKGERSGIEEVK